MIRSREELKYIKNQINRLENILASLKEELLPEREVQYNAMAGVYIKKIEQFRYEVDDYIGVKKYKNSNIDLHMHIEGPSIGYGSVPSSLVSSVLENFKKGLQCIYIIQNNIKINRNTPLDIRKICDLRLTNFQPGSINLSFELPEHQISLERSSIDDSVKLYFDLINWINSDNDKYIDGLDLDKDKFEKLMRSIVNTLPDDKHINRITFSGKKVCCENTISVDKRVRDRCIEKIMELEPEAEQVSIEGIVRGIDLDKKTIELRDVKNYNKKEVSCKIMDDIVDDLKQYLDYKVNITGIKKDSYINIKHIENIDDHLETK